MSGFTDQVPRWTANLGCAACQAAVSPTGRRRAANLAPRNAAAQKYRSADAFIRAESVDSRTKASALQAANQRYRVAFTLVELLIVVAVIAILAGLWLPVLSRSRQTAQRIRCASNLRQLSLAAQMYWDDNNGHAFRYRGAATNGGDLYWFGWLGRGPEGKRAFDPRSGALFQYLNGRGVEVCPSLSYVRRIFKLKATGAAYGYGYNLCLSGPMNQMPVTVSRVRVHSDTAVFADAGQVNDFQAPASPDHPMLEEFYYVGTNVGEATAHFRHEGLANVAFCDGHVGREKPLPGSRDLRLPGQTLGRLRPEALVVP
jgi:prepilin-type processing-associated H-X9-DG protein/prepilin-type N-terminal cleavage/methylation domain-containing protein